MNFKPSFHLLILIIFPALGLAHYLISTNQILSPGYSQLFFLILVVCLIAILKIKGEGISKILLILSITVSITWFLIISKKPDLFKAEFYLARFSDDLYGKDSRRFLVDLHQFLPSGSDTKVYKLNYPVKNFQEAQELLRDKKDLQALIWADAKYLYFHRPAPFYETLDNLSLTKDLDLSLKIVTDVPTIRIYREPYLLTTGFLASLIEAINNPSELRLRSAGSYYQVWHSSIHLAYLRFKLANFLFLEMLNNSNAWQEARYKCILKEYKRATFYLRKLEHPELAAAINNNLAVLRYLKFIFKSKKWQNSLLKNFKTSKKLGELKNPLSFPYQSAIIANENLKLLKALHQKKKLKKLKKKIRKNGL